MLLLYMWSDTCSSSETVVLNMSTLAWSAVTSVQGRVSVASEGLSSVVSSNDGGDVLLSFGGNNRRVFGQGDIEFMDPTILAVGKWRLQGALNSPTLDMQSNYTPQLNYLENEARHQLLMQRSLSPQHNHRFSEIGNTFSQLGDPYGVSSRIDQSHVSNLSTFPQLSLQQSRNAVLSNGNWDGWNELQNGNRMGMAELLRNESPDIVGIGVLRRKNILLILPFLISKTTYIQLMNSECPFKLSKDNIYYTNDNLDIRTWTYIFGVCCATTVFVPSSHNYRIWSFLGLGMITYTAWYLTIAANVHGQAENVTYSGQKKILWLGNISPTVIDNENHVQAVENESLSHVSELIGCDLKDLELTLSTRNMKVGGRHNSTVVRGMVLRNDVVGSIKRIEKAKVAVFAGGVDTSATETKGAVLIHSAEQLENYSKTEEAKVEELIKVVVDSGAKMVVSGGAVGEMALHFCERYKLMLSQPNPDDLGYVDSISVEEIGGARVTVVKNEEGGNSASTVVLRGSTDSILDDIEREVDDGVNTYKAMCRDSRIVPGAATTTNYTHTNSKSFITIRTLPNEYHADGSTGSATPLRVNPVSDPFVADALLALPEPLREALYSSFSKAASSNPVLENIADSISKIGQSILKPQGNSHTAERRLKFRHLTLPEIPHYNHYIVFFEHTQHGKQNGPLYALNISFFITGLYVLAPIYQTLTRSISSDSIWAVTVSLLILHLFLHDYSESTVKAPGVLKSIALTSCISVNASVVASVFIASRLPSRLHVFAIMLFSLQEYKFEINGPWDEAKLCFDTTD
ncbi:hypothetical protein KIW84_073179 [Lathyrus oleraceus]|uniref:Amino acid transporter transmembrane domain-containing protein n=1 Tax=Pisum sativum TaxID=3888 RepID=A0A9D4VNS5_PEA|nr:hypothetical protein KIW84_073179 [Pisum sativum]